MAGGGHWGHVPPAEKFLHFDHQNYKFLSMSPTLLKIFVVYKFRLVPPRNIGHATALITVFFSTRDVKIVQVTYSQPFLLGWSKFSNSCKEGGEGGQELF